MKAKTRLLVLIAVLAAPAGAAEQQLSKDQQDACGAILCLAGGSGVPACSPYLKRFFDIRKIDDRKRFLNQCPSSGLSGGAIGELARLGGNCQSNKLDDYLNRRVCAGGDTCRDPNPNEWRALCGNFYAELTDDEPPKMVERCQDERTEDGSRRNVCQYHWVEASYEVGTWCADRSARARCTESFVIEG